MTDQALDRTTEAPLVVQAGETETLWHGDALWEWHIRSEQTGNRFWLAELSAKAGWGSPVHLHTREDETFFVLSGALHVQVGELAEDIPAGGSAFLPKDLPHSYRIASDTAKFLVVGTPGGFDGWFFETGRPADARTTPPPASEEPDWPAYVAALDRYGVQFIAPPPA
jgi:quercetin dioxygenase-like cupin family protein